MSLNEDQISAFEAFKSGQSIVITGPGGCGKSYLIKYIKNYCDDNLINISVTALTGAAASLVNGLTLHGWAGIGLAKGSAREIYTNLARNRPNHLRKWRETRVLVVDEISMMDATLFNKLHLIGQLARNNNNSLFGGIQLVLCGDFAQLKPIVDRGEQLRFAFESSIWQQYFSNKNTFYLNKIVRQHDPVFQKLLSRIRLGTYTESDRKVLNSRLINNEEDASVTVELDDGTEKIIKATLLYPKRKDVSRINEIELNKLIESGVTPKSYKSIDTCMSKKTKIPIAITEKQTKLLDSCSPASSTIVLAVGAQVMLIKNMDVESGLVNGSRGIIINIDSGSGYPTVMFDNGIQQTIGYDTFEVDSSDTILRRTQIPLVLAWALTIHKCQGSTLSSVITDLTEVFDEAQVYVTLSRAKTIDGLFIINLNYNKIRCNPKVKKYYDKLTVTPYGVGNSNITE